MVDSTICVATDQLVWQYSETTEVAFPRYPKHAVFEQDLVTWQTMEGHYILVNIVARVAQYVADRRLKDK